MDLIQMLVAYGIVGIKLTQGHTHKKIVSESQMVSEWLNRGITIMSIYISINSYYASSNLQNYSLIN